MSDPKLVHSRYKVRSKGGTEFDVWSIASGKPFRDGTARPVIIHLHGGAFIKGGFGENFDPERFCLKQLPPNFLEDTGFRLLSVQYRLALEHPFPAALDDAYAAVTWAQRHATELNIDANRMFVLGISAGGGLGISLVAKARDEKLYPPLRGLMAIYPMVDPSSQRKWLTWILRWNKWSEMSFNNRGWNAYLRGKEKTLGEEMKYAVPLSQSFREFPPTYLDVGTDDLFFREVRQLGTKLSEAKVRLKMGSWEGMAHNFEASKLNGARETVIEAQNARAAWLRAAVGSL